MLLNFLAEAAEGTEPTPGTDWTSMIIMFALIAVIAIMFFWSSRRNKKRQEEAQSLINAVKPGNKVKTIGGICGIVVEVDDEENTFVLETGSEISGKCYMKFDKQAIYQTDAVLEKTEKPEAQIATEEDLAKEESEEKTEE